jgi:hypothetical protein
MMHRVTRATLRPVYPLLLLLAVAGRGPDLCAQLTGYQPGPASDQTAKVKLEGTVINALTGDPLPRALVQVAGQSQGAVLTGPDGRFQFDDMQPGQVNVVVAKPGYFPGNGDPRSNAQWNAVSLDAHTAPITLKMVPQCIIVGHVEEANGEVIEGANIRVFRMGVRAGRKRREQLQVQRTDEDGNFRIANLLAGKYYVAVQARQTSLVSADVAKPKTGYPATIYYPAATDISSATPVDLTPGKTVQVDFSIRSEPAFDISGTVSGQIPGQNAFMFVTDRSGDQLSLSMRFNQAAGTFDVKSVPAGAYVIHAQAADGTGHNLIAELPLNLTAKVTGARLVLEPALSIPVVVRFETTRPHPELEAASKVKGYVPVRIGLHSDDLRQPDLYVPIEPVDDPNRFMLRNIVPGKYSCELIAIYGGYVQSAKYGSTDLLREELVVTRGTPDTPIEIVLRDDSATLSIGTHVDDPLSRTTILVAADSAPMQSPKMQVVMGDGPVTIPGLAPGTYKVFAFDSVDQMEYTNPEVLAQYAAKAVQVNLAPNGQAQVSLNLVRAGTGE